MAHPIIFDIETQHTLREVGYDYRKLKISVVGLYDYATGTYFAYFEKDIPELMLKIEHASMIIGFNINKFDLPVLSPYYLGDITQFSTLDILERVEKSLGFRVALDDLARATLGIKKTGHGLLAVDYFNNKEWDKLEKYCLDDVKITKEIYEYGMKNGKLMLNTDKGIREIPVTFKNSSNGKTAVSLSLPF